MDKDTSDKLIHFAENIGEVNGKLDLILGQTSKTNGHVAELFKRMNSIEKSQAACPVNDLVIQVGKISDETEVPRFYARYPKLLKLTKAAVLAMLILEGFSLANRLRKDVEIVQPKTEQHDNSDN